MGSIELTFIQLLVYFGAVNSIILCALLLYSKKNIKASKWMAIFIAAVGLNLLNYTLIPKFYKSIEWFTLVRIPTLYAYGLLIWLYTKYLLYPDFKLSKRQRWLLVPFFVDILYSFFHAGYIYFFKMDVKQDVFYVHSEYLVHEGIAIIYNIWLYVLAYIEIKKYNAKVINTLSSLKNADLRWLQFLFVLILLPNVAWLIYYFIEWYLYPSYLHFGYYYPLWCYTIFFSMFLGYRSLIQPQIKYLTSGSSKSQKSKYQNSRLSLDAITTMGNLIQKQVEEKKLYLIPNLKLADLSNETSIAKHELSQAISEGLGTNFYDLINRYRVDEVKNKLATGETDQLNLLGIAFESGFNSKTAFNTAFKKYTGTSPSNYLKSLRL